MTTAKAITHVDVKGKMLYYLKITNGVNVVLVNVGEKTFKAVSELHTNGDLEPEPTVSDMLKPVQGGITGGDLLHVQGENKPEDGNVVIKTVENDPQNNPHGEDNQQSYDTWPKFAENEIKGNENSKGTKGGKK